MGMGLRDVGKLLKKLPEFQEKAELHDQICAKTLEIVDEINKKLDNEIIPKLKELEKCQKNVQ